MHTERTADVNSSTTGVQSYQHQVGGQESANVTLARGAQVLHPQAAGGAAALSGDSQIGRMHIRESWKSNAAYGAGLALAFGGLVTSSAKSHAPAALQNLGYGFSVMGAALKVRDAAYSIARATHNTASELPKMPHKVKNVANGLLAGGVTLTLSSLGAIGLSVLGDPTVATSYTPMALAVAGSNFVIVGTALKARDGLIEAAHVAHDPGVASAHVEKVWRLSVNTLENTSTTIGVTLAAIGFGIGTHNPALGLETYIPAVLETAGTTFMVLGSVPKVRDAVVTIARVLHAPQPLHPIQSSPPETV